MSLVSDRIAAFEANLPRMSDDLQRFLDLVWSHRVVHPTSRHRGRVAAPSTDDIYALYARMSHFSSDFHLVRPFLRGLLTLPVVPEIQCQAWLKQTLQEVYGAAKVPHCFPRLNRAAFFDLVNDAEHGDHLAAGLSQAFYHFRRGPHGATQRIYLHVQPAHLLTVMRFILEEMMHTPAQHPGLINAKTSAPGGKERADSIVMYLTDEPSVQAALDTIAAYQHRPDHRALFEPGHTRGTHGIDRHRGTELVGVSTGAEPPIGINLDEDNMGFELVEGSSTFGVFRSALIECAIARTLAYHEDKSQFIRRTLSYFQQAGIDPLAPHHHEVPEGMRPRARAVLRQLQAGQEPV